MSDGLVHWQRCVIDNCLKMLSTATAEARLEAFRLMSPILFPGPTAQSPVEIPSDLVPIDGTFTSHEKKQAPPVKPTRSAVSVIRRNFLDRGEPETDDRGLTSGGTPPEEFWSRRDEYPKARRDKIKPRKMGRPL